VFAIRTRAVHRMPYDMSTWQSAYVRLIQSTLKLDEKKRGDKLISKKPHLILTVRTVDSQNSSVARRRRGLGARRMLCEGRLERFVRDC